MHVNKISLLNNALIVLYKRIEYSYNKGISPKYTVIRLLVTMQNLMSLVELISINRSIFSLDIQKQ